MPSAATELWGIKTSNAYVAAVENDTHLTLYANNGTRRNTMTLQAGEKKPVNAGLSGTATYQGAGSAVHIVSDKPVNAVQMADSDGTEQTSFYPARMLNKRFGLPKDSQYVAIACSEPDISVTLYMPDADPVTKRCEPTANIREKRFLAALMPMGQPFPKAVIWKAISRFM